MSTGDFVWTLVVVAAVAIAVAVAILTAVLKLVAWATGREEDASDRPASEREPPTEPTSDDDEQT
jgi:hypothetical protein